MNTISCKNAAGLVLFWKPQILIIRFNFCGNTLFILQKWGFSNTRHLYADFISNNNFQRTLCTHAYACIIAWIYSLLKLNTLVFPRSKVFSHYYLTEKEFTHLDQIKAYNLTIIFLMQFLYRILFWDQNLLNKEEMALISNSMLEIHCVYLEVISTLCVSIWKLPVSLRAVSLTLLKNSMDRNVKTFQDHLYQE